MLILDLRPVDTADLRPTCAFIEFLYFLQF